MVTATTSRTLRTALAVAVAGAVLAGCDGGDPADDRPEPFGGLITSTGDGELFYTGPDGTTVSTGSWSPLVTPVIGGAPERHTDR